MEGPRPDKLNFCAAKYTLCKRCKDFMASTLDIPSRWDPRAKQSRTVALLAALCAAALFEPFHRADKKKNQNTNVFWFFLVRWKGLEPPAY